GYPFGLEEQEGVAVRVGHDQLRALSSRLSAHLDTFARKMLRDLIDVVDRDADAQTGAAALRLAVFQPNPEPVRPDLPRRALCRHILEAKHRVEGVRPIDVGDRKPES